MAHLLQPPLRSGFSQRAVEDVPGWTSELIAGLDWLRLGELLRAVASNAGCELGPTRVQLDGSLCFAMVENPGQALPRRALVKLTGWNEWAAQTSTVELFQTELRRIREDCRGVLMAPDGFTPVARRYAQSQGIEAVDAVQMYQVLQRLPSESADFLFNITTAGLSGVPSCPVCLCRLSRFDEPATRAVRAMPGEIFFQSSTLVPGAVVCGRLEIAAHCEVTFLHEVRAREVLVRGHVSGDFICEGAVVLEPGATLTGSIAARSVLVRQGAEIIGQFRILDAVSESILPPVQNWAWRCLNPAGKAQCRDVIFQPHH
jgi:Polymer-forming cytoskeletal